MSADDTRRERRKSWALVVLGLLLWDASQKCTGMFGWCVGSLVFGYGVAGLRKHPKEW